MKIYLQLIKYDFKNYGIRFILPVLMVLLITLYKIFFAGFDKNIFEIVNVAVDMPVILFFVMIQIVVPLGIIFQLKSVMKSNLLLMVPKIREKILLYKGTLIISFALWSVIITGITEWKFILFYLFLFSWFVSFLLVIIWGFNSIYNTSKYFILKLAFQFGILWVPYLSSVFKEYKNTVVFSYIILIVLIQFRNFMIHFLNYKENDFAEKKDIRHYLEGDFEKVFGTAGKERSIKNLLQKIDKNPSHFNFIRLYQFLLFKYTGNIILLITTYFITTFLLTVIYNTFGFRTGSYLISFAILCISFILSTAFKKSDIIENLYLMNKRDRPEFEKDLLFTVFWYYSRMIIFVALVIAYINWKIFVKVNTDFDPLHHILLPTVSLLAGYLVIYFKWKLNFKMQDLRKNKIKVQK